jgi:ribosomal protein S18 acetylase RimI-like enzyme
LAGSALRIIDGCRDLPLTRALFLEYAQSLDFDICFDGFAEELASLPGCYGPPGGCTLIGTLQDDAVGCVAVRQLDDLTCEMKRLWVRPQYRGQGHGRMLVETVVDAARDLGYRAMLLHTLESMPEAASLYRSVGFAETTPYDATDLPGVVFLRREL